MSTIEVNGVKYAKHFNTNTAKDGLSFLTEDNDFLQVGLWNYNAGKQLLAHNHNIVEREINRTQEFIFVVRGSLKTFLYDESDKLVKSLVMKTGEGLILFAGGHGYEILENDTLVIETKNGPYVGASVDRRRLQEEENSLQATP